MLYGCYVQGFDVESVCFVVIVFPQEDLQGG